MNFKAKSLFIIPRFSILLIMFFLYPHIGISTTILEFVDLKVSDPANPESEQRTFFQGSKVLITFNWKVVKIDPTGCEAICQLEKEGVGIIASSLKRRLISADTSDAIIGTVISDSHQLSIPDLALSGRYEIVPILSTDFDKSEIGIKYDLPEELKYIYIQPAFTKLKLADYKLRRIFGRNYVDFQRQTRLQKGETVAWSAKLKYELDNLVLISSLINASDLYPGTKVGEIQLISRQGEIVVLPIRVGMETADGHLDNPTIKKAKNHNKVDIFYSYQAKANGSSYPVHQYYYVFRFKPLKVDRLVIIGPMDNIILNVFGLCRLKEEGKEENK